MAAGIMRTAANTRIRADIILHTMRPVGCETAGIPRGMAAAITARDITIGPTIIEAAAPTTGAR